MLMDDSFSTSAAKTGDNIQRVVFDEAKPVACWTEVDSLQIFLALATKS